MPAFICFVFRKKERKRKRKKYIERKAANEMKAAHAEAPFTRTGEKLT